MGPGGGLGLLACLDGYMNIALEQTEEVVNGQVKATYGDAFIRGNNGAGLLRAAGWARAGATDHGSPVLYISLGR
jgi:hypothetical protein